MRLLKDSIKSLGSAFGIGMEKITATKASDILHNGSYDFSDYDMSGHNLERLLGARPHVYMFWFNRILASSLAVANFDIDLSEFIDAKLGQSMFSSCSIGTTKFLNASFVDASFAGCAFNRCRFNGADLRHLRVTNTTFTNCDFRGANLQGAHFKHSAFSGCVFDPWWRMKNGLMVRA